MTNNVPTFLPHTGNVPWDMDSTFATFFRVENATAATLTEASTPVASFNDGSYRITKSATASSYFMENFVDPTTVDADLFPRQDFQRLEKETIVYVYFSAGQLARLDEDIAFSIYGSSDTPDGVSGNTQTFTNYWRWNWTRADLIEDIWQPLELDWGNTPTNGQPDIRAIKMFKFEAFVTSTTAASIFYLDEMSTITPTKWTEVEYHRNLSIRNLRMPIKTLNDSTNATSAAIGTFKTFADADLPISDMVDQRVTWTNEEATIP